MKKIIAITLSLFVIAGFSFAQSEVSALPEDEMQTDLSQKTIVPEDQHLSSDDKSGKVTIEYFPMLDEVRIVYRSMYNLYEKSNAVEAIQGCLEDFRVENQYTRFMYINKDKEKYFKDSRGIKWAEYNSHVKFVR